MAEQAGVQWAANLEFVVQLFDRPRINFEAAISVVGDEYLDRSAAAAAASDVRKGYGGCVACPLHVSMREAARTDLRGTSSL